MTDRRRPRVLARMAACLAAWCVMVAAMAGAEAQVLGEKEWAVVERYCLDCHNFEEFAGGFSFELLQASELHDFTDTWEAILVRLKAGMMPPPGNPRPATETLDAFLAALEATIDAAAQRAPVVAVPQLRRLNRFEYQNAVRDLLELPFDAVELLPADDSAGGFDTVASALTVSPTLLQAYLKAATRIGMLAVGDMATEQSTTSYRPTGESQHAHVHGMPLGTRGGISAQHVFPLDAEYQIAVGRSGGRALFALDAVGAEDPVELVIDGRRVHLLEPDAPGTVRVAVTAGPHTVQAALIPTRAAHGVNDLHTTWADTTRVTSLSITGPFAATSTGETPTRQRIFDCHPDNGADADACAREILTRLATRAYRRPVDEGSLAMLTEFYKDGDDAGGFEKGIQYALTRLLLDPQFLFRFEAEPPELEPGQIYRIDDYELASRLSFFIWSSLPDERLLALAERGTLSDPHVLAVEVERMLADPKSVALAERFFGQWVGLQNLASANPVSPGFDESLRVSMRRETELLFEAIVREDRSVIELLTADYTFVNERLARHYDIPHVRGSRFRKVALPDGQRGGLLGHGSMLTITSAPDRTSPVIRGVWVLENLLDVHPPPPPPAVEADLSTSVPAGGVPRTIRQRLEEHRANPACAACHDLIDPVGFALENFSAIGEWREVTEAGPIDSTARLWDGSEMHGLDGLRNALLERKALFVQALIKKMMTFALGRNVEHADMPAVRAVLRRAESDEYRFSAIVKGVVESTAFQFRTKSAVADDTAVAQADTGG